uniref:Uncharacterized protein n=1 Tax=Solanum lycopersicum TaxID=4081 RepID=A0A3Q7FUB9_SOLLC
MAFIHLGVTFLGIFEYNLQYQLPLTCGWGWSLHINAASVFAVLSLYLEPISGPLSIYIHSICKLSALVINVASANLTFVHTNFSSCSCN